MIYPNHLPFKNHSKIQCLLPNKREGLADREKALLANLPKLIRENEKALERELGALPVMVKEDPGKGPRWYIGPSSSNTFLQAFDRETSKIPNIFLDREREILITDGPDLMGVYKTFSFLRNLYKMEEGSFPVDQLMRRDYRKSSFRDKLLELADGGVV